MIKINLETIKNNALYKKRIPNVKPSMGAVKYA